MIIPFFHFQLFVFYCLIFDKNLTLDLIDDLKYDLRFYVLLYGVNPMRIFIHDQGIARFATEVYAPPKSSNMDNLYIHLTNYAINKYNKAF